MVANKKPQAPKALKNCSIRAAIRFTKGKKKTDVELVERKAAWTRIPSTNFRPEYFEHAIANQGYCQLHAINNAVGSNRVTPTAMEDLRKAFATSLQLKLNDPFVSKNAGYCSGFWNRAFFLGAMQKHYHLSFLRAKLGAGGDHPNFLALLEQKYPEWRSLTFLVYLDYNIKPNAKVDSRLQVLHAVAVRNGHVLDADHPKHIFPLAEYPLVTKITSLYIVSTSPERPCA